MEVVQAHRKMIQQERNARMEMVVNSIPLNVRELWKEIPKAQKQLVFVRLQFLGLNISRAAEVLGIANQTIHDWFSRETEHMNRLMKQAFNQEALKELPQSLRTLVELRDYSQNEETRRKATLDLLRSAGHGVDAPAPSQLNVHMSGENNQFNLLSTRELDEKIDELAKKLGPYATDLIQEERKRADPTRGIAGPPPGETPAGPRGPA